MEEEAAGIRPVEVSSQRKAAGQPALAGGMAGHSTPRCDCQRAGRAFGVHSLVKDGGEKSVENEAV